MKQAVIFYLALFLVINCSFGPKKRDLDYSIYYPPIKKRQKEFSSAIEIDTILQKHEFRPSILNYKTASKIQGEENFGIVEDYRIQFSNIAEIQEALNQKNKIEKAINQEVEMIFEPPFYKLQLGGFESESAAQSKLNYFSRLGIFGFVLQSKN